jgi:hypothetical protein
LKCLVVELHLEFAISTWQQPLRNKKFNEKAKRWCTRLWLIYGASMGKLQINSSELKFGHLWSHYKKFQ